MPRLRLKIEGVSTLVAKMDGKQYLAQPWRDAMGKIVKIVRGGAEQNAPRATGRLASSITDRLAPQPMPMWGVVSAGAVAANGTRYPFVLQAGHRGAAKATGPRRRGARTLKAARAAGGIIMHYRGTGRSTKGWFTKGLGRARQEMAGILRAASQEIERRWKS
jgi:hypothetical protein